MRLVVVESPAKCRKIESYLGGDFRVVASMGHFRDLPAKGLGIDMSTMSPQYTITKPDVAERLSKLAVQADSIYLCTDPDREGEAISWHLTQIFPENTPTFRATFQEITQKAVQKAISNPISLNQNLVDAQQARRILDRIVGYKLSPELWRSFRGQGALSAGRVQSVATRLIVDREREIEAFSESISYKVVATLAKGEGIFKAELKAITEDDKPVKKVQLKDLAKANLLVEELKVGPWMVLSVIHKKQKVSPQAPFTTSNMQAKAAYVLKMSAAKSMQIAQKLYEGGYITYHRTDSVAISDDAQTASRQLILNMFGKAYLPAQAPKYKNAGNAQEAHECIRPTQVDVAALSGLGSDELKLYRLIWEQFISSQMSSGEDAVTVVEIQSGKGLFEARGRTEVFDGFRKLNRFDVQEKSHKKKDEEDQEKQKLPPLVPQDDLECKNLESKEVKTRPPARYSEASLIKKLEKEGIGRPSTYASIVATIAKRGYVELQSRRYFATDLGKMVTDFLVGRFPKVMDLGFTKACEDRLDKIGLGEISFQEFLLKFWAYLSQQIQNAPAFLPIDQIQSSLSLDKEQDPKVVKTSRPKPPKKRLPKKDGVASHPNKDNMLDCPNCQDRLIWRPSLKWEGRYFLCCDRCKAYLETFSDKKPMPKSEWFRAQS